MSRARVDLAGQSFGYWRVLSLASVGRNGTKWLCRCQCGREKRVPTASLVKGLSKSCGCQRGALQQLSRREQAQRAAKNTVDRVSFDEAWRDAKRSAAERLARVIVRWGTE